VSRTITRNWRLFWTWHSRYW